MVPNGSAVGRLARRVEPTNWDRAELRRIVGEPTQLPAITRQRITMIDGTEQNRNVGDTNSRNSRLQVARFWRRRTSRFSTVKQGRKWQL